MQPAPKARGRRVGSDGRGRVSLQDFLIWEHVITIREQIAEVGNLKTTNDRHQPRAGVDASSC